MPSNIDPSEIECARACIEAFSESVINLLQSFNRLLLLLDPPKIEKKVENRSPMPSGDLCPSCGGLVVRTGTCMTCQSCGFNTGCG